MAGAPKCIRCLEMLLRRCRGSCVAWTAVKTSSVQVFNLPQCPTHVCHHSLGCRGFFVLSTGFCEECLPGGRRFCRVVTFREVN